MRSPVPLVLAALIASNSAGAQTLYSQTPIDPCGFGYYSSTVARPNRNFKHADDFTIASGGVIDRVRWWGMSEGRVSGTLGNFSAFTVEVFAANGAGTLPGTLLLTQTFTQAQTSPTPTGRLAFDTGATEYMQEIALTSPFVATAGVKYFLAVSATPVVGAGDAWLWQDGTFVNGASALMSLSVGQWSVFQDSDSAFQLISVPAPGAASPFLLLAAVGVRRRR